MQNMSAFFGETDMSMNDTTTPDDSKNNGSMNDSQSNADEPSSSAFPKLPDIKTIHEHLQGLFDGKIGKMARELAESISGDLSSILGEDAKNVKTNQDILKLLMKNPARIQQLIKLIGEKVKDKLNSGEVDQDQMMKEAVDILSKFKDMGGGMDGMKQMFQQMGVNMPKGARMDTSKLERMTSFQKTKERLKKRALEKQAMNQLAILSKQQESKHQENVNLSHSNDHMSQVELEAISKQFGLDLTENVSKPTDKTGAKTNKKSKK